jgi:hypothetical protein
MGVSLIPASAWVFFRIVAQTFDPVHAGNGYPGLGYRFASVQGYQRLGGTCRFIFNRKTEDSLSVESADCSELWCLSATHTHTHTSHRERPHLQLHSVCCASC